jgi:hypothetical protein
MRDSGPRRMTEEKKPEREKSDIETEGRKEKGKHQGGGDDEKPRAEKIDLMPFFPKDAPYPVEQQKHGERIGSDAYDRNDEVGQVGPENAAVIPCGRLGKSKKRRVPL